MPPIPALWLTTPPGAFLSSHLTLLSQFRGSTRQCPRHATICMLRHVTASPTAFATTGRGTTAAASATVTLTLRHGKTHGTSRQCLWYVTAIHTARPAAMPTTSSAARSTATLAARPAARAPLQNPRQVPQQFPRQNSRQGPMGTGCQVGLRQLLRTADIVSALCGWEKGAE